jgi:asparagine synthase (glutamine-hydrolysing)
MCGIIGVFSKEFDLTISSKLDVALEKLRHRGPNSQAREVAIIDNATIVMGHARLSVIDLTPEAGQPMTTKDGRYSIVFNGEIYNYLELSQLLKRDGYVFKTDSDTEVLLAAWAKWGEACLDRLTGMFAFAILDRKSKNLIFVRDCFGIKPLFVSKKETNVYFSSELPALITLRGCGVQINLQRSYDYLVHGDYDSNEETFIDGVTQLPPGCLQVLNIADGSLSPPKH